MNQEEQRLESGKGWSGTGLCPSQSIHRLRWGQVYEGNLFYPQRSQTNSVTEQAQHPHHLGSCVYRVPW
jgi:hypothetical protein